MSMKTDMNLPTSPNSIKTRFAIKFLQAMKKLNRSRPPSPSIAEKYKRYRALRAAACASMASAVGPKRAWSRAVLRKIKKRALQHSHLKTKGRTRRFTRRKKVRRGNPRENLGFGQEEALRGLVPGGQGMGFCSLLGETAHYIKCLKAQVQVMTNILDHYSTWNKHYSYIYISREIQTDKQMVLQMKKFTLFLCQQNKGTL